MAITRVPPLKNDPVEGYEEDFVPTQDAADTRGVYVQNDSSNDTTVLVSRDASNNMTFKDGVVSGTKTLTDLLVSTGISSATHQALRQLIHFVDNGPANGFASLAYRETTPSASIFPTAVIWYDDSTKAKKLVEKLITYTGVVATSIQWKMYDTDGTTVLATVTDAITYSGIFETSRTRTIA